MSAVSAADDGQAGGNLLGDALQKAAALRAGGNVSTAAALDAAKAALDAARDARGQIASGALCAPERLCAGFIGPLLLRFKARVQPHAVRNASGALIGVSCVLPPSGVVDDRLRSKAVAVAGPGSAEAEAPLSPFAAAIAAKAKQKADRGAAGGAPPPPPPPPPPSGAGLASHAAPGCPRVKMSQSED